jgi:hypothetical protein
MVLYSAASLLESPFCPSTSCGKTTSATAYQIVLISPTILPASPLTDMSQLMKPAIANKNQQKKKHADTRAHNAKNK